MPHLDRSGARIWWHQLGLGSPLLIIQGLGYPSDANWRLLPRLSEQHTLITLDNRGVGRTESDGNPTSIVEMADDAAAVIEAAGHGPAHVLGFSMGGLIAQEVALRRPELARTLILGCTSPGGKDAILMTKEDADLFVDFTSDMSASEAAMKSAPVVYGPGTERSAIHADIDVRMARPTSREGYLKQLAAVGEYEGSGPRLSQLRCPVLLIHGTADRVVPVGNVDVTLSYLPHSAVAILPGAGHIITTDDTHGTAAAILEFTAAHERSTADLPTRR